MTQPEKSLRVSSSLLPNKGSSIALTSDTVREFPALSGSFLTLNIIIVVVSIGCGTQNGLQLPSISWMTVSG